MNNDKIFCGRGRAWGQYGQVGLSICIDEIPPEYIDTGKNGKRYIRINVTQKKDKDQYGYTHSVTVDTWRPSQNAGVEKKPDFDADSFVNRPKNDPF